ncbi:MAG TPA: sugar transferase [Bacteroidales bacterium]|nr:sugar transferase [Bacteroidales bacterium]
MQKGFIAGFTSDIALVTASYISCVGLKPGSASSVYYHSYADSFLYFILIWTVASFLLEKYNFRLITGWSVLFKKILICNVLIFFAVTSMMYVFQSFNYSRFIVLGTIGIATFAEIFTGSVYMLFHNARVRYESWTNTETQVSEKDLSQLFKKVDSPVAKRSLKYNFELRESYLRNEIGIEAYDFIKNYAAIDSLNSLIISTTTTFNIDAQIQREFEVILNVKRVNDFRYINKFFESVNSKLPVGGIYIDFFETVSMRKKRILGKYPVVINYMYYAVDFIIKRVFPKFALTKKLYFILTRGENRVLSKAETFGRLYSCGFEILDEKLIGSNFYFVAIKVKDPMFPSNPSYGPVIALERIGRGGKIIKVYKMRTMHPYAEYLQDYIYKRAGLQEGGKFKDDFRVTTLGKIMRVFWLDELPMIINLLKGDLKIFGVRPLSRQYFRLYTRELQRLRILTKPGLIPPFYVDYPKTLEEIIASELKYLRSYCKHPLRTDWNYFWRAVFNIVFRRYRSK